MKSASGGLMLCNQQYLYVLGALQLKLKHDVLGNMGSFELEGPSWEVGYRHAGTKHVA
jgi:hypothetical protein